MVRAAPVILLSCLMCCHSVTAPAAGEDRGGLADSLTFYASFDDGTDADFGRGDRRIYTAADLTRKDVVEGEQAEQVELAEQGKWGKSLRFGAKSQQVVFYRGADNVHWPPAPQAFAGTVSLWMSLAPDQDLAPGYVDPLQITDKEWNNACLFLDFTKDERPRHFRLGVFSDYAFWNPEDRAWDAIPVAERPMAGDQWTHVVIAFRDFNLPDKPGVATLYLNGRPQGNLQKPQKFAWDPAQLAIILGIYYTGRMDDLAIFNRELTAEEVRTVFRSDTSLKSLLPAGSNPEKSR
jgi:hypothetical protein